ncbi:LYPLA1 [Bugula neritina]|uniref:palmitoyl-protein hydrolase n=1 Tax=Bugula neritina TaxID=10212 RepID=A0A7J7KSR9_BUGNE|nr:LYPLA1 [Bugula neritina]
MAARVACASIAPTAKHTATVIFLHGLGDTGDGWCQEFRSRAQHPWIKYIFPHAPTQPVSLNMGMNMPSWFDIKGLSPDAPQDEVGLKKSSDLLRSIIDEEAKSIPSERIVIGGFSQGGAVAIYTSLTSDIKLGGLLAFSTWLPLHTKVMDIVKDANKKVPTLQCHGDIDPMVPFTWGKMTAMLLKQLNPEHEMCKLSGVMHSSSPEEMEQCRKFLLKSLPSQ